MPCCLDISDVELTYNRRSGYDVIFNLQGVAITDDLGNIITDDLGNPLGSEPVNDFVPLEGDYYTIDDDIATLVKVIADSGVTDATGGSVTDDSGGVITAL